MGDMRQAIYVDESIHDRGDFIVTALVAPRKRVDRDIDTALRRAGLMPGIGEYKSSARMDGRPELRLLRSDLLRVVLNSGCRLALIISDRSERNAIAQQLVPLLEAMIERGRFEGAPLDVFLDQGLAPSSANDAWLVSPVLKESRLYREQDSRVVRGLQLADMCAHNASAILLSDLGLLKKMVRAGEGTPFDPDEMLELEYTLWSSLRYCLASEEPAYPGEDRRPTDFTEFDAFGLFVSDACRGDVKRTALNRFATVYMGCIL